MFPLPPTFASRTFDPGETPVIAVAYKGRLDKKYDLLRARREQLEANQHMLLGRLAYYLSQFIGDPHIPFELMLIGVGYGPIRRMKRSAKTTAFTSD